MKRGYATVSVLVLLALIADVAGWLGPRDCPRCQQPRSLTERIHGMHACATQERAP